MLELVIDSGCRFKNMKIGKWNYTAPQKIRWNNHYESLVKNIEDKSSRQFRKNLFTESFREINLNLFILSGLSESDPKYAMYKKRVNAAVERVRTNEKYLLSICTRSTSNSVSTTQVNE